MNISTDKLRKQVERVILEKVQCAEQINRSTGKKYELLREKYKVLNEKYWLLQEKLDYYECETVASDDEIELKRISPNIDSIYPIYLKSEAKKIGHIDYSGYHSSVIVGDVGYIIDADYRGNNYAYKALILLSDYLYRNNIPDFYISVFFDNTPSLKIILKTVLNYDGDIVSVNGDMVTFKCITKEIKKKTM